MTKEKTLQYLNNNQPSLDQIMELLNEYIFERKGTYLPNTQIRIDPFDLMRLQQMYQIALDWFAVKFNVCFLQNKQGEIIKIY